MKPWREVAVPHSDVLEGTFLQSEFAADITAVHTGNASPEYQDATSFFQRTFITDLNRPVADWNNGDNRCYQRGFDADQGDSRLQVFEFHHKDLRFRFLRRP